MERSWWKEAVVYQIYVRSFCDSNGDGIGDLNGIIGKVPYLKDLGVDAIYLSPINRSPNMDFGFDVSDYYDIQPEFGTLKDFQELVERLHGSGMRLIMDLVINHTSDQHPWFQAARESRQDPHHDWYIWKEGDRNEPPNNWGSFFSGSAWEYNEPTGEYYLHLFSPGQPDLNYREQSLREEIKSIIRFWIRQGVDGFRFDAVNHLAKDMKFPDGEVRPGEKYGNFIPFVQNLPEVHRFIRELRHDAIADPAIFVSGEAGGISFETAAAYTAPSAGELDVLFHFDMHSAGRGSRDWLRVPVDLGSDIKKSFSGWSSRPDSAGWNALFFSNHDFSRMVSRLGDDMEFREDSAKALFLLQMTQRGTPFLYYGDEIAMTNAYGYELEDYRDGAVFRKYREEVLEGSTSHKDYLAGLRLMNRDNARTPMQWTGERNAGFTEGKEPWIPLNDNFREINAAEQLERKDSVLNFCRRLIHLRRDHPTLIYGSFREYLNEHDQVYAYTRQDGPDGREYLMLLNLTSRPARVRIPEALRRRLTQPHPPRFLLGNLGAVDPSDWYELELKPWQSILWVIKL